jgi:hypothetical protein
MKSLKIILLCFIAIFAASCESDDGPRDTALFAVPKIKSLAELRNGVSITGPTETNSDGKIYVADNYLFYIAAEEGVHIFNNSNPASPQNIAFLSIEGVHDIAVKGNYLYADNFVDLLVFDISNPNNIALVRTVENAIAFSPVFPDSVEFYDYTLYPETGEIITGYTVEERQRPEGGELIFAGQAMEDALASGNGIGTSGSYAKFQINNNALYTIDSYQLYVFNISDPVNTYFDKTVPMMMWFGGGQFETLFRQRDYLFVGSTTGMYVVDASDEFNPYFISGFSHATACDPVVVNGNTAYITVRGGSSCGAIEDQVNVIDITDITNPLLVSTYVLGQPYGLGFHNDVLYVCCGTDGLKVFDASNTTLELEQSYPVTVKDVIAMDSHLIAVGDNKITQYSYGDNYTLQQISVVNF